MDVEINARRAPQNVPKSVESDVFTIYGPTSRDAKNAGSNI
jgi:hypothetical protein